MTALFNPENAGQAVDNTSGSNKGAIDPSKETKSSLLNPVNSVLDDKNSSSLPRKRVQQSYGVGQSDSKAKGSRLPSEESKKEK